MAKKAIATPKAPLRFLSSEGSIDPTQPLIWKPVFCVEHHFENLKTGRTCGCAPGPQVRALVNDAYEVLLEGTRGSMKTEVGRGWLLKGNRKDPIHAPGDEGQEQHLHWMKKTGVCPYCVNQSYITHPRYRALILRENEKDLKDWMDRAAMLYVPMGAEVTRSPAIIKWPLGAQFILGHMQDANAYTDYQGSEFHKILFEEVQQTKTKLLYQQITMSCRSTFICMAGCKIGECLCAKLDPQVMATANPLGKGHGWVKKYFISIGKSDEVYTDPATTLTRVHISSSVMDNPYLMANKQYVNQLESLDEPFKSAWRYGNWDILAGSYFVDFRPNGPVGKEKEEWPHANHVIKAGTVPLMPWWGRAIGVDWGRTHRAVVEWGCQNQADKRLHIYREFVANGEQKEGAIAGVTYGPQMDIDTLGAEVARRTLADFDGSANCHIPLWLSHDAFDKNDSHRTFAEQFRDGVESVLGRGSAFLVRLTDEEKQMAPDDAWHSMQRRYERQSPNAAITIRMSTRLREDIWQYIRSLLRFRTAPLAAPDFEYLRMLMTLPDGVFKASEYMRPYEQQKTEVVPKIQIWDCCPAVIQELTDAIHEEGTDDVLEDGAEHSMDALDALRHLVAGVSEKVNKEPLGVFVTNRVEKASIDRPWLNDPTVRAQVVRKAQSDYGLIGTGIQFGHAGRASVNRRRNRTVPQ